MADDYSYGIVPLRRQGSEWFVLLIQHSSARYWGFPKGHAEVGESPRDAAVRELREETQLDIVRYLSEFPIEEHYHFLFSGKRVEKVVYFFPAEVQGEVQLQQEEVSDCKWVSLATAADYITYETGRAVCRQVVVLLA